MEEGDSRGVQRAEMKETLEIQTYPAPLHFVAPGSLEILLTTLSQIKCEDRFVMGYGILSFFFSRFPRELFSLTYPQRYCGSKQAGRQASKPGGRTASQAASTQASKPNRTQSEIHTLNLPYINPKPSLIKLFEPTSTINKRPKPTLN